MVDLYLGTGHLTFCFSSFDNTLQDIHHSYCFGVLGNPETILAEMAQHDRFRAATIKQ